VIGIAFDQSALPIISPYFDGFKNIAGALDGFDLCSRYSYVPIYFILFSSFAIQRDILRRICFD
jgi:hypothetical protein